MGGGNHRAAQWADDSGGLSPRGRGKQYPYISAGVRAGSIPAWAGETTSPITGIQAKPVYPRVGGGNAARCMIEFCQRGLSPRGRGKLVTSTLPPAAERSIPAWAGETSDEWHISMDAPVYPRVGGGNEQNAFNHRTPSGLSPRGRGKPLEHPYLGIIQRSIPAWAGETSVNRESLVRVAVYPRVGGGNKPCRTPLKPARGLSPRGRGKLLRRVLV